MSHTESGFESDPTLELNSNTSVNMLPNHGYTSGFTDGIHNKRKSKQKRELKITDLKDSVKLSKKSSEKARPDFLSPPESQSECDSSYKRQVINRKHRNREDDTLSQSSQSVQALKTGETNENFDPLNPMMGSVDPRQFYHPYVQEVTFWNRLRNSIFEMLEVLYFFFMDMVEGMINLISRLFCGCFAQ